MEQSYELCKRFQRKNNVTNVIEQRDALLKPSDNQNICGILMYYNYYNNNNMMLVEAVAL